MNNQTDNRTVKTLLLCRLNSRSADSNTSENYLFDKLKDIYRGNKDIQNQSAARIGVFAAIGKVDAVSLYDPTSQDSDNWLEDIRSDKIRIIHQSNADINYHPIHLVANRKYEEHDSVDSAAVITLIYGINVDNAGIKKNPTDTLPYEKVIYEWLKNRWKNKKGITDFSGTDEGNFNGDFEIYCALNICDIVMINYTTDLKESLETVNSLNEQEIARKTLSLICLPIKEFKDNFDDNINAVNNMVNGSVQAKDKNSNDILYSIRLEGSIRNQKLFDEFKKDLKKAIFGEGKENDDGCTDNIVFGQSDFSLQFNGLIKSEVENYIRAIFSMHQARAQACWEAHTEFLYKDNNNNLVEKENYPKKILNNLYQKFAPISKAYYNEIEKNDTFWKNHSWFNGFYELLGVHANIDADPVLHGPSYLIYRFVSIMHHYMNSAINAENEKKKIYLNILDQSEKIIKTAIQDWGNLTDQILRVDDLIFQGFGNSSALYNSLPECSLDFYHAMILCVVEFVYMRDITIKAIESKLDAESFKKAIQTYCYDFLMLPNSDTSIRIGQMFKTDELLKELDNPLKLSNPVKQVYLVGFPIHNVYYPLNFFVQLVHECFHNFGDVCRLRKERCKYLCAATSEILISQIFCGSKLKKEGKNKIKDIIQKQLEAEFADPDANSTQSVAYMEKGSEKVLSGQTLFHLRVIAKHNPALYPEEAIDVLKVPKDQLDNIMFFFSEGYADLMTILLLKLNPDMYFKLLNLEDYQPETYDMIRDMQRYVLVSAAIFSRLYNRKKLSEIYLENDDRIREWNYNNIIRKLSQYFEKPFENQENSNNKRITYRRSDYMIDYFEALLNGNSQFEPDERAGADAANQTIPILCMNEVMEYLVKVIDAFVLYYENDQPSATEVDYLKEWYDQHDILSLKQIRDYFDELFVEGHLFSEDFFNILIKDHKKVRELVKSDTNQTVQTAAQPQINQRSQATAAATT